MAEAETIDFSSLTIRKLLCRDERQFLEKCRSILSDLTGEEFIASSPDWLRFATMQLESDGYCEILKMSIDYTQEIVYELPKELCHLYEDREQYDMFAEQLSNARMIYNTLNGVAVIPVHYIEDDDLLRDHFRNKLHLLTRFRVWVGSPRCKCPPLRCVD